MTMNEAKAKLTKVTDIAGCKQDWVELNGTLYFSDRNKFPHYLKTAYKIDVCAHCGHERPTEELEYQVTKISPIYQEPDKVSHYDNFDDAVNALITLTIV